MRHKYETRAIVLSRSPVGEASSFVLLLTPELGLVRALAQSVRLSSAKLSHALTTFAESDVVLVKGRDGWRLSGAVLGESWFKKMENAARRRRAARVSGLLLRLVVGEAHTPELFPIMKGFFTVLAELPDDLHESAEILAGIRILSALGLDTGEILADSSDFSPAALAFVSTNRASYISRINRGIEASGL